LITIRLFIHGYGIQLQKNISFCYTTVIMHVIALNAMPVGL